MKVRFSDRSPRAIAVVAIVVLVAATFLALNLTKLPGLDHTRTYTAEFANSAGLEQQDMVAIAGVRVGFVTGLKLDRKPDGSLPDVIVTFTVNDGIHLGDDTSATAKVQTPLGTEYLQLVPAGTGRLSGPIPVSRTQVPYTLVGDLYQLTNQVEEYNIPNLVKALQTSSATFAGTPASEVAAALSGLARFSEILAAHRSQLATIVTQGSQLTALLNQRSGELVNLVGQGNLVLQVLQQRQADIKSLLDGTAAISAQLTSLLGNNKTELNSLLTNLNSVSGVLAKDSNDIGAAIPLLASFSRYAANVTGSGPFADASAPAGLFPDNLLKQCGQPGAFPSSNSLVGCRP